MTDAPLMLSVSGLRGIIGSSLTAPVAARYGAAFGQWLWDQAPAGPQPRVIVGRDSRPSGQMIELAVAAGLIGVGCRVVRLGIVTTPGTAVMIDHLGADGGMVITASHNPIEWNGIKALARDGSAPPAEQIERIIERFRHDDASYVEVSSLSALEEDASSNQVHVDRILKQVDVDLIRSRKIKVVLDSVRGAGGPSTAMLLQSLGAELIALYPETTGRFPHAPEPAKENLTGLCDAVRIEGADVGFAQDPDADRLAIVDDKARYVGEEYTLALAGRHLLPSSEGAEKVLVTNLSTSRMVNDIAAQNEGRIVRTPVGEANVAGAMRKHRARIGGEGNGGVILPAVSWVRDSLVGIALILEMLARSDQRLSKIVDMMPRYAIVKDKVQIRGDAVGGLAETMRRHYAQQQIDLQDGVRVDWPDRWVHVRPSNTEPLIRIIAEARDEQRAADLVTEVRQVLGFDRA